MNIHEKKIELVKRIVETQNPDILHKIDEFFIEHEQVDWEQLDDEEKDAIEKGLYEADKGHLIPHEEIMKEFSKK